MTPEEVDLRLRVVAEAKSWIGTPYVSNGAIKGKRGGTDCAMLLVAVYANVGFIPKEFDPRPYAPYWHVHQGEERYLGGILQFVSEVPGPLDRAPLPGDVILFQIGKLFAHGAIITDWPNVIHAIGNDAVMPEDISKSITGKRALAKVPQKFFSIGT